MTSHDPGPKEGSRLARLFLNDTEVGRVSVRGHSGSWTFGEFAPSPRFSDFARVFAQWSMLMHSNDSDERVNASVSEKLRDCEYEMDALRASLVLENPEERHQLRQLNIDGCLIEWKH